MQKLGSILVITLLLIAYGRCVSDQYGILHTTKASCCQTICTALSHCNDHAEDSCTADHDSDQQDGEHNNEENPAPCQLCFILSNDSMVVENGVKIPCPALSDFNPAFDFGTDLDSLIGRISSLLATDLHFVDLPDPPAELSSLYRCMVMKTTPVRGPSIA
ncbi:hypothetical protein NT6N_07800 [Oceaniferula spumae]|uniref:Secreted protein n=1 Tax=Oceaniferula spumae TaxID=2979115 RepID=A0AAT9FIC2_9BACT